jgi:hypothetical protein
MMNGGYDRFAEALVFVHGPRAEVEAALHAVLCETSGDAKTAETWRRVQSTLAAMNQKKAA